eukprot:CAMPEP_0198143332 /NCGR_PEP_ID=MMETSP1443-20131203/6438_1 /TAXON_ID=186043 /ORGANISM="Entomoneis sp., Strain CCMP2396" /LENGTH=138 /DNA_ID=CAMNT_0043806553 /DNA_START=98 /DNA_END=514 /DNA_ORIENTATION=-
MAASPLRFSLKSHSRKRRSVHPFQEKPNVVTSPLPKPVSKNVEVLEITNATSDRSDCISLDRQSNEVFRQTAWIESSDEEEEMRTLKRANPIYDEDDEFYQYESPAKRSKNTTLDWQARLSDDLPLLLSLDTDHFASS